MLCFKNVLYFWKIMQKFQCSHSNTCLTSSIDAHFPSLYLSVLPSLHFMSHCSTFTCLSLTSSLNVHFAILLSASLPFSLPHLTLPHLTLHNFTSHYLTTPFTADLPFFTLNSTSLLTP